MTKSTLSAKASFVKRMFCCKSVFAKWEKKVQLLRLPNSELQKCTMLLSRLVLLSTFSSLLKEDETGQTGMY